MGQLSDNSRSKSRMNKFTLTFVLLALPNVVNFTPNFQFSWGYDNTTITIQLEVVTAGWVSIAVLKDDGKGFDMWWGGFDEDYGIVYGQDGYASFNNLVVGPRYPDTFNNLNVVQVAQSPFGGTTRLRFSRPIISPDYKQDVNIPYNTKQLLLWSYSNSDSPSAAAIASGSAQLKLRPTP